MDFVLLIHMAIPVRIPCIPRVTKNGGIVKKVMSRPFRTPTTPPRNSAAPSARRILSVAFKTIAAINPTTGTTPLIVRSIPPVASTKVIPTAITEIIAVCLQIFRIFVTEKNIPPSQTAKITVAIRKII